MKKPIYIKKGNFRIDEKGNIDYYVGWCGLEYQDIEDIKYLIALKEKKELGK